MNGCYKTEIKIKIVYIAGYSLELDSGSGWQSVYHGEDTEYQVHTIIPPDALSNVPHRVIRSIVMVITSVVDPDSHGSA
jgi:hypothetical protein